MAGLVVVAAGLFGMIAVGYANTSIPTGEKDGVADRGSVIYYADGRTVLARLGVKRTPVTYDQIPRAVQDAVIAAENSGFREDAGIDFSGMVRSLWSTVSGQQVQGASTITQQMARNYYDGVGTERSIQRKIKEIFVAVKLNKTLPKEEILEKYLNTIYFGRGAYGIGAAAQAFFGKRIGQLTPEQGAYLAGRIQNPDAFDRAEIKGDTGATEFRYRYVTGQMAKLDPVKYGDLPAASPTSPKRIPYRTKDYYQGANGYMVVQVLEELKTRDIQPDEVRRGGYRIISTFDRKLMEVARQAVKTTMATQSNQFHAGLAAVNPRNGRVVAFYGGDDYEKNQWNTAFDSAKQAASAFKPYVLAAWLKAGYSLDSHVPGNQTVPRVLPGQAPGGIRNEHPQAKNAMDVTYATAHSINTAYASMAYALPNQIEDVREIAERAGLDGDRMEDDVKEHGYQFSIGSAPVTPVEQAAGYSMFANQGRHTDYHVVQAVYKGKELYLPEQRASRQVISAEVAADATSAMRQVLTSGTAGGKGLGNRPSAGKTGTNNDNKEAWFVGYTPQLSVAVGMYREECRTRSGKLVEPRHSSCPLTPGGRPSKKYGDHRPYTTAREVPLGPGWEGAGPPTTVWRAFMLAAHEGKPIEHFAPKAGIGQQEDLVPKPAPTPPTPTPPPAELDANDGDTCDPSGVCDGGDLGDPTEDDVSEESRTDADGPTAPPPGGGSHLPGPAGSGHGATEITDS
ncbi:transglycosylase domain-containing protein [Nonomuraea recticatena]|uniref:Transglycosylase domain-containing protein n=1 Tax=Nonomuraea recticatena TaxID=46178 RepID=A0ABP6DPX1_9ACTN